MTVAMQEEHAEPKGAPLPSVRRLPIYLHLLMLMKDQGRDIVSCTHIANELKADPTQVRKDLAITGIIGKPKVGYDINELIASIQGFLGWNNTTDAFLVGVGSMGTALLGHKDFANLGLNLVAAFDVNPTIIGHTVHGRKVFPLSRLVDLASRMHIHIGVMTVPPSVAQDVANMMVKSGILAIWNFTSTQIEVPPGVIVERADLTSSLAALTSRLRQALAV